MALSSSPTQSGVATMAVEGESEGEVFPETPPLEPGVRLGAYEVRRLLGRGGMGDVYEVEHKKLGRRAALKLLKPDLAQDRVALRRFFGEARAVGRVAHDGLVDVFDLVDDEDHAFFVMELLQGETLSERLRRAAPFDPPLSVHIARQVADTMAAVHRAGIVHRDLKPDNIFLFDDGEGGKSTKILDFGVAKLKKGVDVSATMLTAAGSVIGTPAYMSPEQISSAVVDARSDVYSWGIVMFEMVTGSMPFVAKSYGEFLLAHMAGKPRLPSDIAGARVSPALEKLIVDCLAKKPDQRPQSMDEVRRRLDRAVQFPETVEGRWPDGTGAEASPPRPTRTLGLAAMATVGLVAAASALLFNARAPSPAPQPPPATAIAKAPPAMPAAPAVVSHTVTTTPAGAEVWDIDGGRAVGATPFELKRSADAPPLALRISTPGFVPREVSLGGTTATHTELVLNPLPVKSKPKASLRKARRVERSAPRVDDDAVIDPFAP